MEYKAKRGGGNRPQTGKPQDDPYAKPSRGGRGQRPGTAYQSNRGGDRGGYSNRGADRGTERGNRGRGRGAFHEGRPRKPVNTESWAYKYRNEPRPSFEQIDVTVDTKLPELPSADEIIKKPSEDEFRQAMRDLDEQAELARLGINEFKNKRKEAYEGLSGMDPAVREKMMADIESLKKFKNKKSALIGKIREAREDIGRKVDKQSLLTCKLPRHVKTEKDLNAEIKNKQKKYETSSLSNAQEKQLLKEIDALKQAGPIIKEVDQYQSDIVAKKEAVTKWQEELDGVKQEMEKVQARVNQARDKLDSERAKNQGAREEADKHNTEVEKGNANLTDVYKQKDELRENYYK